MKNLLIIFVFAFTPTNGDMLSNHIVVDEQNTAKFFFQNTSNNTLNNVQITFSSFDNSLITIDTIIIDSIAPNINETIKAKIVLPSNWQRKTYVVEATVLADDFKYGQVVTIYSNANKGKLKWLGFGIVALVAAIFIFIFKKFS